jgi:hypothetical protein
MSKRRTHSPECKARVAMEAISGRKTIQETAADHSIHPIPPVSGKVVTPLITPASAVASAAKPG